MRLQFNIWCSCKSYAIWERGNKERLTLVSSAGCCGPDLQIEDRVLRRVAAWMGVLDNLSIVGYLLLMVETESAVMLQDGWESQVRQGQG